MGYSIVALQENRESKEKIDGFGQLWPLDFVNMLYVDSTMIRHAIGGQMYQELEKQALIEGSDILTVKASRLALPFFTKMGFCTEEHEWITVLGLNWTALR